MPKTYMDLKKPQYNEIDENVYEKIKKELPMENRNVYEQFLADIPLNDIGSVKIDKGNDNSDRLKKDLAVSANEKKSYFEPLIMQFSQITESLVIIHSERKIACCILHINFCNAFIFMFPSYNYFVYQLSCK